MESFEEKVNRLFGNVCINGTMKDYEKLHQALCSRLIYFSAAICGSFHLAEEIVSDVFIMLWQKRGQLINVQNPRVYLYICTKNSTLNALKKNNREVIAYDALHADALVITPCVEEHLVSKQVAQKIEAAIRSLPTRCQLIFRLIKIDGLRYKEVAELMNISTKTVDAQLIIAVKKLAETIRLDMTDELIADYLHH